MKEDTINSLVINKKNLKSKEKLNKELFSRMVNIPGFLNYNLKGRGIEVKPGRFSPVYINMKATWTYPEILFSITERLTILCEKCDCVIGIESGGSPYASLIAKDLKISLILARKEAKEQMGILAGFLNGKKKKIAIVDDILATGKSSERGFLSVKNKHSNICIVSVLSYGMDKLIAKKYGLEVKSLYKVDDLLNSLNPDLREQLLPHIRSYQEKLEKIIKT